MNYEQQIDKFLNKTGGIITTSDCNNMKIPTIYLTRLVKNDKLFRVKKGIYIYILHRVETMMNYIFINTNIVN